MWVWRVFRVLLTPQSMRPTPVSQANGSSSEGVPVLKDELFLCYLVFLVLFRGGLFLRRLDERRRQPATPRPTPPPRTPLPPLPCFPPPPPFFFPLVSADAVGAYRHRRSGVERRRRHRLRREAANSLGAEERVVVGIEDSHLGQITI